MIISTPNIRHVTGDAITPAPRVIVKPSVATICNAGTVQMAAFLVSNQMESALTSGVTWASSNEAVATVDENGLVTAVGDGKAFISAIWMDRSGFSEVTCSTEAACCSTVNVVTLLMIDNSRSMEGAFNAAYPTLLAAAKRMADVFAGSLDVTKDVMALGTFSEVQELLMELGTSFMGDEINNLSTVFRGQDSTDILSALRFAIASINGCATCNRKVIVFFSDGESRPDLETHDYYAIVDVARKFKESGGIIICVGLRASGSGYLTLQAIASNGFFLNVWGEGTTMIDAATETLLGLRGYLCADYYTGGYVLDNPPGPQLPDPFSDPDTLAKALTTDEGDFLVTDEGEMLTGE
jgi:hypothetical protein